MLADLTQFVTAGSLARESVHFTNTQNVQDLRMWIAAEGDFNSLSGRRLRRTMNTLIRGKPIHSHLSERLVYFYLGNSLKRRGAHNETKDRVATKVCAAANDTKNDWRAAWDTYEQGEKSHLEENKKPSVHWRDALTGSVSDKHRRPNKRNKAIIALAIRRFAARARAADAVKEAAFAHAAPNSRKGVIKARSVQAVAVKATRGEKRESSKRMKQINEATRDARAEPCDPARVDLGKINLLMHIPTKAVLAAECHLRSINDASADDTQIELIERLSSYHKLRNEHPTLIPEMTVAGKAKTMRTDRAVPKQSGPVGSAI